MPIFDKMINDSFSNITSMLRSDLNCDAEWNSKEVDACDAAIASQDSLVSKFRGTL